jgi:hypothetical protein
MRVRIEPEAAQIRPRLKIPLTLQSVVAAPRAVQ